MDPNKLLGIVMVGIGLVDLWVARRFADKLTGPTRGLLPVMGIGFIAVGAAIVFGLLRVA